MSLASCALPRQDGQECRPSADGVGRPRLGERLVADGLITPDQLARALEIRRATGERLGRVLLDMGVEPYLVASALDGVAAQRLVRVLCPKCREPDPYGTEELRTRFGAADPAGTYYLGRGCEFCNYTR